MSTHNGIASVVEGIDMLFFGPETPVTPSRLIIDISVVVIPDKRNLTMKRDAYDATVDF